MRKNIAIERALKKFGANLKIARLRRNLSQDLIAERAGFSLSTLSHIEKGNPSVSIGNYAAYCNSVGLDIPFASIADPLKDETAFFMEMDAMRKRARKEKEE